jgi:Ca2+-binding RTX toxin-like protein
MTFDSFRPRRIGLAATAALGLTFATAAPALAEPVAPAPAGSASNANGTLTVMGTAASDRLALRLAAGNPGILQLDFGDDGSADLAFDRSTFTSINVFLLGGNDEFRVDQVNGAFSDEALTIYGGSGNDHIDGGDGNEVIYGDSGHDVVDGNHGHDIAFLGSGEDTFKWDPGDGSDDVDGGSGMDTLVFNGANGAERMSLFSDGARSVFLRDPGAVRMNMDDVEQLDVHALDGADSITIGDMTGTDLRRANIDLSAAGAPDSQQDTVTLIGTPGDDDVKVHAKHDEIDAHGLRPEVSITGNSTADTLDVNTLDGNDRVRVDDAVAARIGVNVDLGAGQL